MTEDQALQWSPPLKGGSTADPDSGATTIQTLRRNGAAADRREHTSLSASCMGPDRPDVPAAMEPAAERREHADRALAWSTSGLVAAMEPAAERREHAGAGCRSTCGRRQPQWSPPLNGGSIVLRTWMPWRRERAAMEPAVERAGAQLVRRDILQGVPPYGVAAMEPRLRPAMEHRSAEAHILARSGCKPQ